MPAGPEVGSVHQPLPKNALNTPGIYGIIAAERSLSRNGVCRGVTGRPCQKSFTHRAAGGLYQRFFAAACPSGGRRPHPGGRCVRQAFLQEGRKEEKTDGQRERTGERPAVFAAACQAIPEHAGGKQRDHQSPGDPQPAQGHRAFHVRPTRGVRGVFTYPQQRVGRGAGKMRHPL